MNGHLRCKQLNHAGEDTRIISFPARGHAHFGGAGAIGDDAVSRHQIRIESQLVDIVGVLG